MCICTFCPPPIGVVGSSGSAVERRTPESEVGVRNLPPPCCVIEQDTLLPESTGNTQEAVAPSGNDWKIVDWDVKPQHKYLGWRN